MLAGDARRVRGACGSAPGHGGLHGRHDLRAVDATAEDGSATDRCELPRHCGRVHPPRPLRHAETRLVPSNGDPTDVTGRVAAAGPLACRLVRTPERSPNRLPPPARAPRSCFLSVARILLPAALAMLCALTLGACANTLQDEAVAP